MRSAFMNKTFCAIAILAVHPFALPQAIAETTDSSIVLLPRQIEMSHSGDLQRLSVVEWNDEIAGAVIDDIEIESSDSAVVKVVGKTLHAVSDGTVQVTATKETGKTSSVEVTVSGTGKPHRWSFRNDVQSVLAKQGCNMGACHGALAGKGGFVLSLRGYDSDADFRSITRQARGRRIEMADPGRSLLLAKPTGALPHKGGLRLDTESRDYEILAQWIAKGAAAPSDEDALIEKITVTPENAKLNPGDHSQVLVTAHYSDGSSRDVTHWAQFTATDEAVAGVDEDGRVQVNGSGEAAVLVWYASQVALARMTVPYPNAVDAEAYAFAPRRNFIDDLNLQQLETLQLPPSDRCDDATFLRRATLDSIGRLPTQAEHDDYFAMPEHHRREALIDQLLAAESFTDYWSYKWSDVLVINGNKLRPVAVKSYYDWLHDSVRTNKPWDELVREILTSTGSSDTNGATNFFAVNQTPEDMTESACQSFLGLSIGCAKCHNHPLEKWTNDQYYAMANLFSRVRAKGWGGDSRNGDGLRQLYVSTSGELVQPKLGKPQPPAPLDSKAMAFDDPQDRREVLAEWLTDPSNPYFARSITNRVWANFFGRGLVEQVDDLRLSNPASNEALLNAAAQHLSDAGFDLKTLMRTILQSETYQRSSLAVAGNREDPKYLSHYAPRRLMAEVLLDSMDQVLGTSTSFTEIAFAGADKQKTDFYKAGTRAIELYDSAVDSYFLKTFGRNPREIVCECERDAEPSMVQVLHLSNGETLNPKLNDPESLPSLASTESWDRDEFLDVLFQRALSREPTAAERESLVSVMDEYADDKATAMRDVAWSVLTSVEFTYNH
ncbi:S-layer protein [Rhodopirellula bahusiensis]|uniref:S-layer protein n=2 Tax=Rhodopirellula bahusiensis TaxID=2014065 RepID=A0A2G1W037_9BACT|nr:DUF1553 domain-containing protein [Rhodopirellula bahusiensis]PHQ32365.1 S-layer protein [Rhodopirellula bahusiensis]